MTAYLVASLPKPAVVGSAISGIPEQRDAFYHVLIKRIWLETLENNVRDF